MSRRLIDIDVWKTSWFRKLPPEYKSFWLYLQSHCDIAGVWEADFDLASFSIGKQLDPPLARNLFSKEIIFLSESKWLLKDYVKTQNGDTLNPKSPIHRRILQLLKKHNIDYQKLKNLDNTYLGTALDPKVVLIEVLVLEEELILEEELALKEKLVLEEKVELEEKEKEEKAKSAVLPFPSEDFSNAWKAWKAYKESQFKFWYKTVDTEQIALKQLSELASGEEQTAIKIIQQSIANGWKGFFELKSKQAQNDGKYTAEDYQQLGNTIDEWFDRKYGV